MKYRMLSVVLLALVAPLLLAGCTSTGTHGATVHRVDRLESRVDTLDQRVYDLAKCCGKAQSACKCRQQASKCVPVAVTSSSGHSRSSGNCEIVQEGGEFVGSGKGRIYVEVKADTSGAMYYIDPNTGQKCYLSDLDISWVGRKVAVDVLVKFHGRITIHITGGAVN